MRPPNVQVFTNEPMKISHISDGARLAVYAVDGTEIYNRVPSEGEAFVRIDSNQYPVTIRVRKEGYVPLVLHGLENGNLTIQHQPEDI